MARAHLAIAVAAVVLTLTAYPSAEVGGDDLLSVEVSPELSADPGLVRLLIRLEPHQDNRSLVVELDSLAFFRSSLITLEGEAAPTAHWLRFDSLPAGAYMVIVRLVRQSEVAATVRDHFMVVP